MRLLVYAFLGLLLLTGAAMEAGPDVTGVPRAPFNIVLIVSDDHGREALGCYGNPQVVTPNLDRLATEGTLFYNAFCSSASCSPSRATILTGLHGHSTGMYGLSHAVHHFSVFEKTKTLPQMLADAGYRTRRVGKAHYQPLDKFPFDENPPEREFNRDDVAAAESCREFIQGKEPFFLYFCSFNPHRDGNVVEENPYRPNSFGNPEKAFPGDTERPFAAEDVIVPPFLNDTPEARAELAQYYQSIARLDRGIGRLLDILREEGKYEQTLIIYISDNGAAFPGAKTTLYDPGMRLPCIVRAPGQERGGIVSNALVSWVDITPTILDFAAAVPGKASFHGKSLRPVLDDPSPAEWRDKIYASHSLHQITNYYPMRVFRTQRYKFIWNIAAPLEYPSASDLWESPTWQEVLRNQPERFGGRSVDAYLHRPSFELYDLQSDPGETNNLAVDSNYRELVESFKKDLQEFQQLTKDPWAHKWIYE